MGVKYFPKPWIISIIFLLLKIGSVEIWSKCWCSLRFRFYTNQISLLYCQTRCSVLSFWYCQMFSEGRSWFKCLKSFWRYLPDQFCSEPNTCGFTTWNRKDRCKCSRYSKKISSSLCCAGKFCPRLKFNFRRQGYLKGVQWPGCKNCSYLFCYIMAIFHRFYCFFTYLHQSMKF